MPAPHGPLRSAWLLLASIAVGAGCQSRNFATEGDRLRERVLELETENRQLAGRAAELETRLAAVDAGPGAVPEELRGAIPHVAEIRIDRLSHVAEPDQEGSPGILRVYVKPRDGRGRFLQLTGRLAVSAAVMPEDADAVTVGRTTLSPLEVREAYRGGWMGAHYSVELPIALPSGASEPEIIVQVTYTDGRTGRRHADQRAIALSPLAGR